MTKKEIFDVGLIRGEYIASWQSLPKIGTEIKPFVLPNFKGKIKDTEDAEEVFMSLCWLREKNSRKVSPFVFTTKELNDLNKRKSCDAWNAWNVYKDGIYKGFAKNWNLRVKYYKD